MAAEEVDFWSHELAMEPELTESEKALRDKFVDEYLVDFKPYEACIRVGFMAAFARQWADKFMDESYVQRRIRERKFKAPEDEKAQAEIDKQIALSALRQAAQHGPYPSRVAAASRLVTMLGIDAPTKVQNDITMRGGVMMVPAIANIDEWEQAAIATQDRLVQESRH